MVRVSFRHSKLVQLSKSSWQYLLLSFVSSFLNTTLLHKNAFFWSSDAPRVKKSGIFGILTKFHRRWSRFYIRHTIFDRFLAWIVSAVTKLLLHPVHHRLSYSYLSSLKTREENSLSEKEGRPRWVPRDVTYSWVHIYLSRNYDSI